MRELFSFTLCLLFNNPYAFMLDALRFRLSYCVWNVDSRCCLIDSFLFRSNIFVPLSAVHTTLPKARAKNFRFPEGGVSVGCRRTVPAIATNAMKLVTLPASALMEI